MALVLLGSGAEAGRAQDTGQNRFGSSSNAPEFRGCSGTAGEWRNHEELEQGDSDRRRDRIRADAPGLFGAARGSTGFSKPAAHHDGAVFANTFHDSDRTQPSSERDGCNQVNENKFFNGFSDTVAENMKYFDVLGGPDTYEHFRRGGRPRSQPRSRCSSGIRSLPAARACRW